MPTQPLYIGLDVGGTSMKAGVVNDAGRPLSNVSLPTEAHRGQEFGLERMAETIRAAAAGAGLTMDRIAAVGVATPGTMDIPAGVILDPPNLHPWRNVPVRQYVQGVFRIPTAFQNDANAAALGEFWVGAGRGVRSLVMFTLGTGIGGGIILGGKVLEGEHSHGGEVGHIKIEMTKPRLCGCGRRGCLEAYASAPSVVKRAREALAEDGGRSSLHRLSVGARSGDRAPTGLGDRAPTEGDLTSREVFDAAAAGDELAAKVVEDTAFYLAVGAMNLMHVIDPDMVVFGGGMIAAGEPFLERIRHHVRELAFPVPAEKTRICYAELGSDAGFIGAAACGRQLVRGGQ
jgi:glucokinase